jgi:hypothetical protein
MPAPKTQLLETQFLREATQIDLVRGRDYLHYLIPNEKTPLEVAPFLRMTKPGIIVSVGTERSFFDLVLSDPTTCQGLVVRDHDPQVKGYVDFNVLLLRIAENREDYVQLSTPPPPFFPHYCFGIEEANNKIILEKIQKIRLVTERADIPPVIKEYYLRHLDDFGLIYFNAKMDKDWTKSHAYYEGVKYYQDDQLFNQLQRYARSGNIIAIEGSVDDLTLLDERNIEIADISNIPDYSSLHFKTISKPKIIWAGFWEGRWPDGPYKALPMPKDKCFSPYKPPYTPADTPPYTSYVWKPNT